MPFIYIADALERSNKYDRSRHLVQKGSPPFCEAVGVPQSLLLKMTSYVTTEQDLLIERMDYAATLLTAFFLGQIAH